MNNSPEKLSFFDTVCGFALKLFGILLFADFLAQIFMFVFGMVSELLGEGLTDFLVAGMGAMIMITSVYQVAWQRGFREIGLVSRRVTEYSPLKGLSAGFFAVIPSLLSYVFLLIASFFGGTALTSAKAVFALLHSYGYLIISFFYSLSSYGYVLCAIMFLPILLIAWLGYEMGYRNILISKVLIYGKNGITKQK